MRLQMKDIHKLFKRLPKYANLILKTKKKEHNEVQHKIVNNTNLIKKEI